MCYQAVTSYAGHLTPQLRCCAPSPSVRPSTHTATRLPATQGARAIRAMIQPAIAPAHTASVGKALPLSSAEP